MTMGGSYAAGQELDHVLAKHWGASNLRKVLQQIYAGKIDSYKGFFNVTEKGLMSDSTIKTYDMQDAEFDDDYNYVSVAKEYTTTDVLYASRYDATLTDDWENDDTITVGATDSLTIDKAHRGGKHWLRTARYGSNQLCLRLFFRLQGRQPRAPCYFCGFSTKSVICYLYFGSVSCVSRRRRKF